MAATTDSPFEFPWLFQKVMILPEEDIAYFEILVFLVIQFKVAILIFICCAKNPVPIKLPVRNFGNSYVFNT